jgi:AcrR family transcriptional regulator
MSTMPERSERKDAAVNRRLILATAQGLFDSHGVDSVSMHQIAKAAGIGQGTLYRRYSSKSELCIDLLMESFQRLQENTEAALEAMKHSPVRDRLEKLLGDWIVYLAGNIRWINTIKASCRPEDMPQFYKAPPCVYFNDLLVRLIDEAVERGETRTEDTAFSAFYILSSITPDAILFLMEERGYTVERLKSYYVKHLLGSLFSQ